MRPGDNKLLSGIVPNFNTRNSTATEYTVATATSRDTQLATAFRGVGTESRIASGTSTQITNNTTSTGAEQKHNQALAVYRADPAARELHAMGAAQPKEFNQNNELKEQLMTEKKAVKEVSKLERRLANAKSRAKIYKGMVGVLSLAFVALLVTFIALSAAA